MTKPKDLSTLTPEELMEIAKLPTKDDHHSKNLPMIKQFVIGDGIQEGEDHIPAAVIYDRYCRWCKINNIEIYSIVKFFKELKIYFTKIRKSNGFCYKMSQNGFDLSLENIDLANIKTVRRNSGGWKKRQKKKKSIV